MAITINGTGSISGLSAGGLPNSSVTAADLATVQDWSGKTISNIGGGGKVLQIQQAVMTDTQSFSGGFTTFEDVTNLSVSITPSASTSKVLVMYSVMITGNTFGRRYAFRLSRGGTAIGIHDSAGSKTRASGCGMPLDSNGVMDFHSNTILDSPATTSATTYKVQVVCNDSPTVNVNIASNEADNGNHSRPVSSITVMEIAG